MAALEVLKTISSMYLYACSWCYNYTLCALYNLSQILLFPLQLFSKHESDEEDILKHTQELLDELGPASDECDVGVACDDVGGACEDGDSSDDQCGTTMDTS